MSPGIQFIENLEVDDVCGIEAEGKENVFAIGILQQTSKDILEKRSLQIPYGQNWVYYIPSLCTGHTYFFLLSLVFSNWSVVFVVARG